MRNRFFSFFLDLLFPAACAGCGVEGVLLCTSCASRIRHIPPSCFVCKKLVPPAGGIPAGRTCEPCRKKSHIYAFFSPFSYQDPMVRELIHNLKYLRVRPVADELAALLERAFRYYGMAVPEGVVLVPVPLHRARKRSRGFNQSELIARRLAERWGAPIAARALEKTKNTKPQMELGFVERQKNVRGAFSARQSDFVQGRMVFLIDDVKTTGATMDEAASTLKAAGARAVWAIAVAH